MREDPQLDITIIQGETFRLRFMYAQGEAPVDFEGCTFACQMRADYDGPVVANLTTANGRVMWDAQTGFELYLPATETKKLKLVDEGVWDLFATYPGPARDSDRLIFGAITYQRAVTR